MERGWKGDQWEGRGGVDRAVSKTGVGALIDDG